MINYVPPQGRIQGIELGACQGIWGTSLPVGSRVKALAGYLRMESPEAEAFLYKHIQKLRPDRNNKYII